MLTHLQAWLNGARDYNIGVSLYCQYGEDKALAKILVTRKSSYLTNRLYDELLAIYELKKQQHERTSELQKPATPSQKKPTESQAGNGHQQVMPGNANAPAEKIPEETILNTELYQLCLDEAHRSYKECMNLRAVLLNSVPYLHEQVNRRDLVQQRSILAIKVVKLSLQYGQLYDRADFVKRHGRLPLGEDTPGAGDQDPAQEVASIADSQVKQKLDNARKSLSKLKNKEPTAERLQLIQEREILITHLEQRWASLQ